MYYLHSQCVPHTGRRPFLGTRLMQLREIIAVYFENYVERMNGLRKQSEIGYGKGTTPYDTFT